MSKRIFSRIFFLLTICISGNSQVTSSLWSSSFEVGKPSPELKIDSVEYFNKASFSISDFKGKWVMLYFFGMGCSSSFSHLQSIDSLRQKMSDKVQILLIGKKIENKGISKNQTKEEFEQFRAYYKLRLPVVYNSKIFKQMDVKTAPYTVLIDPLGIVRSVFSFGSASLDGVTDFIEGNSVRMPGDFRLIQQKVAKFNPHVPLLVNNNGGDEVSCSFRTIITGELPIGAPNPICVSSMYGNNTQLINITLKELLLFAYSDTIGRNPNIQPNSYSTYFLDPVFDFPISKDDSLNIFFRKYCYSQVVPMVNANAMYMQEVMRDNLKNYFGLTAAVEKRSMSVYKLITIGDTMRLSTKGGEARYYEHNHGYVKLKNAPITEVVKFFWARYRPPITILDGTGIKGNIDLLLSTIRGQPLEDAIRSLNKNGLDLIQTESEMNVIVVSKRRQFEFISGK